MTALGSALNAVVAPPSWEGALLSQNVLAIRSSVMHPELLLFLLMIPCARRLYERRNGDRSLAITPTAFRSLFIPLPPWETQEKIVIVLRLQKREEELVERIVELKRRRVDAVLSRYYQQLPDTDLTNDAETERP